MAEEGIAPITYRLMIFIDRDTDVTAKATVRGLTNPTGSGNTNVQTRTFHLFSAIKPLEIRESIYTAIVAQEPNSIDCESFRETTKAIWCPSFLPNTCRTSRAILNEAAPVFIRNSVFQVRRYYSGTYQSSTFLATLDNGFQSIRELNFSAFCDFPGINNVEPRSVDQFQKITENEDIELMARCPGLHTLHLAMQPTSLVERRQSTNCCMMSPGFGSPCYEKYDPIPLDQLVQHYALEGIFRCGGLRKIVFEYTNHMATE
ncbi:hypothetical protein K491DRAFT_685609 [Lophiostoma macrostomum CBS 122681]|uniref:Uncharacterized protein n=1 Tax=Lophiostoma macrostomum CBS 122681 TaxID=1314788 RepID=A0A6A6SME4_9PLEO|nr:hypothetical protein K491DRAFT_685609 [Lophiostoma macrostomum CBS 122681]